jgi:hypothetical protein
MHRQAEPREGWEGPEVAQRTLMKPLLFVEFLEPCSSGPCSAQLYIPAPFHTF